MAVLWIQGKPARWFEVELGYNGLERKLKSGDGATPEGLYRVVRRKGRGETRYYKALLLDYPNAEDRQRFRVAKANGEVHRSTSIGSLIEVHGDGGRGTNWTDGCVAVTNEEMDYLFEKLPVGSPVVIVGSYENLRVRRREAGIDGND
jgi:murein L,D-transpeptidase YafK